MGVPQNGWFIRENPIKMDDDWRYPYFRQPPYFPHEKNTLSSRKLGPQRQSSCSPMSHGFPSGLPNHWCCRHCSMLGLEGLRVQNWDLLKKWWIAYIASEHTWTDGPAWACTHQCHMISPIHLKHHLWSGDLPSETDPFGLTKRGAQQITKGPSRGSPRNRQQNRLTFLVIFFLASRWRSPPLSCRRSPPNHGLDLSA